MAVIANSMGIKNMVVLVNKVAIIASDIRINTFRLLKIAGYVIFRPLYIISSDVKKNMTIEAVERAEMFKIVKSAFTLPR